MRRLKIAYVTIYDASDVNNWSGTGHYIAKTVEKYLGDITYIGNLKPKKFFIHYLKRAFNKIFNGKSYDPLRSELTGRAYSQLVQKQLVNNHFDLIFCPDTLPIAYLETNIPIVFWNDANFHGMIDYQFMNLCRETLKDGDFLNKNALDKASLAIYSSDWAANGAIEYYKAIPNNVKVIPFGANMESVPDIEAFKIKLNDVLNLLFVGKDWENKGGKIAYETMTELNKRGIHCSLTVVGCTPPIEFTDDRVIVIPFLDKNKCVEAERLRNLYMNADFFILPTRKECYGVVFCESAAFGLPVLSTRTGGIPTIIKDGINGFLFPLSENGQAYADKITEIVGNGSYEQLCYSSRKRYNEVLNWDVAGEQLKIEIEKIIND